MSEATEPTVTLPATLIGRADLARLVREIETVDNDFEVQKVRDHKTAETMSIPTMSRALSDFLQLNKITITDPQVRMDLKKQLGVLKDKAPSIRMVFAAEPEPEFVQQLVTWIRQELHPGALLTIGLQPGIIGGVYIRTPNHIHDFTVRKLLADKRGLIRTEFEAILQKTRTPEMAVAPVPAPAAQPVGSERV